MVLGPSFFCFIFLFLLLGKGQFMFFVFRGLWGLGKGLTAFLIGFDISYLYIHLGLNHGWGGRDSVVLFQGVEILVIDGLYLVFVEAQR